MRKMPVSSLHNQREVNTYFRSQSLFWQQIYSSEGAFAEIIQDRHTAIQTWINGLTLASGSRILEVGCGAGFLSIVLAQRGFRVQAIDSVEAMVELVRQQATEASVANRLSVNVGDVYSLAFEENCFDLVIAVGVLPWLERADRAIEEMARVTKPDGYIILTTANPLGLPYLLDPVTNPVLQPLKKGVRIILERVRHHQRLPSMAFHGRRSMNKALAQAKLTKTRDMTLGFEFTLFHHRIVPEPLATTLYRCLQRLADRNVLGFRSRGMSYHVLARKPTASLLDSLSDASCPC